MIPGIRNGALIQKPVFPGMFSQTAIQEVTGPVFHLLSQLAGSNFILFFD